jgi:hypothetical protein
MPMNTHWDSRLPPNAGIIRLFALIHLAGAILLDFISEDQSAQETDKAERLVVTLSKNRSCFFQACQVEMCKVICINDGVSDAACLPNQTDNLLLPFFLVHPARF